MTAALLIAACGLSHREAAEYLGVTIDTVRSWHRRKPTKARPESIADLARLYTLERMVSAEIICDIRKGRSIPHVMSDKDARRHGLPCVGAYRMACAMAFVGYTRPY